MAKSKYETHVLPNLAKIERWLTLGATGKEVAKKLGLSYDTIREYRRKGEAGEEPYSALSAAFASGCEEPDDEVEVALFNRARGIHYEEKTYKTVLNEVTGEFEEICEKRVTKYIPPDPTSAMFWLTNRRGDRWRYKPAEQSGDDSGTGVVMIPEVAPIE